MVQHSRLPEGMEALFRSQPEVHQPVAVTPVRGRRYRLDHRRKASHMPKEHHNQTTTRGNPRKRKGSVPYVSRPGRRRLGVRGFHTASVSVEQLVRTANAPPE